jgi:hypothetical protein
LSRAVVTRALRHQHTRLVTQPRRPHTRRRAHGTWVTSDVSANAWRIAWPLAGPAMVGDVPIKPIPSAIKADSKIMR